MFNRLFNLTITRVALLVGALMAISLVALPVYNLAFAQENGSIEYVENDMGTVATFTAMDPEEASPVLWSLLEDAAGDQDILGEDGDDNVVPADVVDFGHFNISDAGVLTFEEAPDYEMPSGEGTANTNTYKVVVQASDGTEMSYFKVTVNVTDLEEEGSAKLRPTAQEATTLLQPQVGVRITAHSLTDPERQCKHCTRQR